MTQTDLLIPVIDMSNEEFEKHLLIKYGTSFHIVDLNDEDFARFEKTADPMIVEIMKRLRAS